MFSHVLVGARGLARMGAFYDAVLAPIGLSRRWDGSDGGPPGLGWAVPGTSMPTFFVPEPIDRGAARAGNGRMAVFLAPSPGAVRAAHLTGERPHYGRGYHGAYLRDPGGNKLHVVNRGDSAGGE